MLSIRAPVLSRPVSARRAGRVAVVPRAYKGQDAVKGAASKAQSTIASVSKVNSDDVQEKIAAFGEDLKAAWDKTEDKPAVIVLGTAAFVALLAAGSIADAVDRVPIISGLMRLVGLIVTGWFTYRYLAFKPDREELLRNIDSYIAKILGK